MKQQKMSLWQAIKTKLRPLFTKEMIPAFLLGEALYWSPIIVLFILSLFYPAMWGVLGAVWAFWVLLLPAIPIQIVFILTINKIIRLVRNKKETK